jgi:hypothetical protein
MPTTIKLLSRTSKAKKNGTVPIWRRITAERNADRQQIRKSHPIAPKLNPKLREL